MNIRSNHVAWYALRWLDGVATMPPDERGVYDTIINLIYARDEDDCGIEYDERDLAHRCHCHWREFRRVFRLLLERGKVRQEGRRIYVKRCAEELHKARTLIAKNRHNGAKGGRPNGLAEPNGFGLRPEIREDKSRSKKEETPNGVSKKERGCRIDGFQVPDNWFEEGAAARSKANLPAINLTLEWDKFFDYWRAKSGKDGIKLDWLATWRNWCRNARGVPIASNQEPDELTPEMKEAMSKAPPGSSVDDKMWCIRLQRYLKDGSWLPTYYGPPPNEPFSQVPHVILTAFGLAAKESLQ